MGVSTRTWLFVAVGFVLVVVLGGGGLLWFAKAPAPARRERAVAARVQTPATALGRALASVGSVDAAIRVGVDLDDYTSLLASAGVALDAYRPPDEKGAAIKRALAEALLYYGAAREAWELDLASSWWDGQDKPSYWKPRYPQLDLTAAGAHVSADQVRAAAWAVAGASYAQAKKAAGR